MIEARSVSFSYGRELVLDQLDARLGDGLHLVLGPNGCGKSTLLRLLAGIEMPHTGTITVDDHDLWRDETAARARLAYVPEHPDLSPYATLGEVCRLVAQARGAAADEARVALDEVGMGRYRDHTVRELSLGQRRRALLATARIRTPQHLLLDEPLDALDRATRQSTLEWIDDVTGRGHCVAIISHDLEPFAGAPASAGFLDDGAWHAFEASSGFSLPELDDLARGRAPASR